MRGRGESDWHVSLTTPDPEPPFWGQEPRPTTLHFCLPGPPHSPSATWCQLPRPQRCWRLPESWVALRPGRHWQRWRWLQVWKWCLRPDPQEGPPPHSWGLCPQRDSAADGHAPQSLCLSPIRQGLCWCWPGPWPLESCSCRVCEFCLTASSAGGLREHTFSWRVPQTLWGCYPRRPMGSGSPKPRWERQVYCYPKITTFPRSDGWDSNPGVPVCGTLPWGATG